MLSLLAITRRNPFSVIHFHRFCFSSTNPTQIPHPKSPSFIVDYLISSFGFSPDKAATVSKRIAHLDSPQNPDSVRHFLKHHGFTDPQIKTIITWFPQILSSSIENTLDPNLHALREMGLSSPAVAQIVLSDPRALLFRTAAPRIKFCKDFLDGSEAALVRACKASRSLACLDFASKIALLHSLGLSTHEIQRIVCIVGQFINNCPASIKNLLNRAKELGFHPGSPMFVHGLRAISWNSREALQKKMELLKSYGWSEDDFFAALQRSPSFVHLSEKNLRMKMDFFMAEVRCAPSYIASYPVVFSYSLEKRLRPRHHVLHLLETQGLSSKGQNLCSAMLMTNDKFVEKYILPHKERISRLHEAYLAACVPNETVLSGVEEGDFALDPNATV